MTYTLAETLATRNRIEIHTNPIVISGDEATIAQARNLRVTLEQTFDPRYPLMNVFLVPDSRNAIVTTGIDLEAMPEREQISRHAVRLALEAIRERDAACAGRGEDSSE